MKTLELMIREVGRLAKGALVTATFASLLTAAPLHAQGEGDCGADAGTLYGYKPSDCLQEGGTLIGGIPAGNADVPAGFETIFVLTAGADHIIVQTGTAPIFNVEAIGHYTIHTLVYDPATLDLASIVPGTTTAAEVNALLIQGGGAICASLDLMGTSINVDNPDAGSLTAEEAEVCLGSGMAQLNAIGSAMYVPDGYNVGYVLTEGGGLVIQQFSTSPSFLVDAIGNYTIHTLVYDPATLDLDQVVFGVTTGSDINELLFQGGGNICAALDVTGAPISVTECVACTADAGTLQGFKPVYCYMEGGTMIGAQIVEPPVVPAGLVSVWIATHGEDHVIEAIEGSSYFTVSGDGLYTIHTLVYDPAVLDLSTFVEFGVTTAAELNSLLIQGGGQLCGSLDMEGVWMMIDTPLAGNLSAQTGEICLQDGSAQLNATVSGSHLPIGYAILYLLVPDEGTVIELSTTPSFNVTGPGTYSIHTFVYEPASFDVDDIDAGVSTLADLNNMLVQGGGIHCAALDLAGLQFSVIECGSEECTAFAGTITPDQFETCLTDLSVAISAEANGDMIVPAGHMALYLLSTENTIVDLSTELLFEVGAPGTYRFHTLIYDPSTWNASSIELGTTAIGDLAAMFLQGGGSLCGNLDESGAGTIVIDCTTPTCTALAGTLTPGEAGCLMNGSATLIAVPNDENVVPEGYSVAYLLTEGLSPVYHSLASSPQFTVSTADVWRIHTLVYDPATLDVNAWVAGETTVMEMNAMLIQGGGAICAALDIYGAMFMVEACADCEAFAGSLTAEVTEHCVADLAIVLDADPAGDAVVPAGSAVLYILAMGEAGTIMNVSETPEIFVELEGSYTIHTLIYDPLTLDLGFVVPGVTTIADLHEQMVVNGNTICADLDLVGASFSVIECGEGGEIVNAWPVPAVDRITLEFGAPLSSAAQLMLIDVNGTQVLPARSIAAGSRTATIDIAGLGAGHYVVRMIGATGVSNHRFSKVQ